MPILLPTPLPFILIRLILPHALPPAKRILNFPELNRLQLRQQLTDRGPGLVAAALVFEGIVAGAHGDGFDGYEGGGRAGGGDFAEGGEFFVFDLGTTCQWVDNGEKREEGLGRWGGVDARLSSRLSSPNVSRSRKCYRS